MELHKVWFFLHTWYLYSLGLFCDSSCWTTAAAVTVAAMWTFTAYWCNFVPLLAANPGDTTLANESDDSQWCRNMQMLIAVNVFFSFFTFLMFKRFNIPADCCQLNWHRPSARGRDKTVLVVRKCSQQLRPLVDAGVVEFFLCYFNCLCSTHGLGYLRNRLHVAYTWLAVLL